MSHRYLFILFFSIAHITYGQVTVGTFIQSALNDPKVKSIKEQIRYLNEKPYRLSPLQRLEVRGQHREFDLNQFEYGVRLTPANPWEVRSNNQYFKEFTSTLTIERDLILKEALLDRYYSVIEYSYREAMRALHAEREKLIHDQILILEKQAGSSYFDADEYLDLQVDHLDIGVELEQVQIELIDAANRIDRLYANVLSDKATWSDSNLVATQRIKNIVDSLTSLTLTNTLVTYQKQKIALANSEYKLERSNVNLGFIQTEFDNRRVEQDRTPFNISLGITIPITNPNKGDMAKRKLDAIESRYDLEEAEISYRTDNVVNQERIGRLIERHSGLTSKMEMLQNSTLAGTLSTLKGGDPRYILRFQENQVKLKAMLALLRRDILISYVDFLASTDKLQEQPLVNYLSNTLEQL